MFTCPKCHARAKAVETRVRSEGTRIYRRRKCLTCGFLFSTNERCQAEAIPPERRIMHTITERDMIKQTIAEARLETFQPGLLGVMFGRLAKLDPETATAAQVDQILENNRGTTCFCDGCGNWHIPVLAFRSARNEAEMHLCLTCLRAMTATLAAEEK
jgi:hypothetical protein